MANQDKAQQKKTHPDNRRNESSPGNRKAGGQQRSTGDSAANGKTASSTTASRVSWLTALLGSLLLWSAYSPLDLRFTALFALAPWLWYCLTPNPLSRLDYFKLWVAGAVFWLLILQGIRLAYYPLYAGWIALSLYLAIYIPLFIGMTRVCLYRWRIPLPIAAPVVWASLELTRAYLLTGFAGSLLAHSLAKWPITLQLADQISIYGIGMWIVLVNVWCAQLLSIIKAPKYHTLLTPTISVVIATLIVLGYGFYRLRETEQLAKERQALLRIALIQENAPTMFEATPELRHDAWQRYAAGTKTAASRFEKIDVVVWPESVFTANEPIMRDHTQGLVPPELKAANITAEQLPKTVESMQRVFNLKTQALFRAISGTNNTTEPYPVHFIVGTDIWDIHAANISRYNTAAWISPEGQLQDSYAKMHLVMFGEYFPFNGFFGLLYKLFGMAPLAVGEGDKSFLIKDTRLAPSVCFESMVPQRISTQVRSLTYQDQSPDILVNVTNDGWFRGSSMLDHHLACSIADTIENRRPMVIAANTGLSAWIDGAGQLRAVGNRMTPDQILAEPYRDSRWGLFQTVGDWPIRICTLVTWLLFLAAWRRQPSQRREDTAIEQPSMQPA